MNTLRSRVELNLIVLPIELEIGKQRLLDHRLRDIDASYGSFAELPAHNVPLYDATAHIDNRSYLTCLLWLVMNVGLLVLLTNRAIVPVVADTVHLLETELLVLALLSDHAHHDVVVLDENHGP